jgi:hypothetical protein
MNKREFKQLIRECIKEEFSSQPWFKSYLESIDSKENSNDYIDPFINVLDKEVDLRVYYEIEDGKVKIVNVDFNIAELNPSEIRMVSSYVDNLENAPEYQQIQRQLNSKVDDNYDSESNGDEGRDYPALSDKFPPYSR